MFWLHILSYLACGLLIYAGAYILSKKYPKRFDGIRPMTGGEGRFSIILWPAVVIVFIGTIFVFVFDKINFLDSYLKMLNKIFNLEEKK